MGVTWTPSVCFFTFHVASYTGRERVIIIIESERLIHTHSMFLCLELYSLQNGGLKTLNLSLWLRIGCWTMAKILNGWLFGERQRLDRRLPPYPGGPHIIWAAALSADLLWFVALSRITDWTHIPARTKVCGNVRAFSKAKRGPMCRCQVARGCIGSRKLENCKNREIVGVVAGQQECYNSCPHNILKKLPIQYIIEECSYLQQ